MDDFEKWFKSSDTILALILIDESRPTYSGLIKEVAKLAFKAGKHLTQHKAAKEKKTMPPKEDVMNFGKAIESLRIGKKISRTGWNRKGMFLFLICGNAWEFTTDVEGVEDIQTLPFICMKTADNHLVPWLASQTDVLAEDWGIVE